MAEYSKVKITFLIDYDINYLAKLVINDNVYNWNWVSNRTTSYEITTGTPTATAGETTAINFSNAFLLDFPNNFVVTQTSNEVLIASEVEGVDFRAWKTNNNEGTTLRDGIDFNIEYLNYEEPPSYDTINFALVKSPHYINIPFYFDTTVSATVKLYVWDGALGTIPTDPNYTLTIPRPSINFAEFNIDISDLIDENLIPKPTINLTNPTQIVDTSSDSVKWVYYTASYNDSIESIASIDDYLVAVEGYGYYNEGTNPTKPTNNILTSSKFRKVSRDGFVLLPYVNNGTITSIDIESSTGEISSTETLTPSDNSSKIVQYVQVDLSNTTNDEFITLTFQPSGEVISYEIVDECRYNPIQVLFKNKYGQFDQVTLFKKSNVSSNVTREEFVNNYVKGGLYDVTEHQYKKINVVSKESIKVNSGYINEQENELYKQLLLSDVVYLWQNENLVPVNVNSSNLEYKTRVNDKLVNYTLEFEYAYNIIQNV